MKVDLLTAIGELKGMTDVFVMTHNIDFVFLQTLALRTFNRSGQPRITVFADAHCSQDSFAAQQRLLSGLGTRYRVVPVAMQPGFRFHPKAVLLAGEKAATLFVGSGNLGFAGWRENAEVWVRFDVSTDGMAPFAQFRAFASKVIEGLALNEGPRRVLAEIFDPDRNRWAAAAAAGSSPLVVGRAGRGEALLQDLVLACDGLGAVDELYICCPYYDQRGAALRSLLEAFKPAKATLLYQPLGSTLSAPACAANPSARLQHVGFARQRKWGGARQAFLHAKFYALRQGDQVLVLAGSANCSVAALTLEHRAGNAELMAVRRISRAEFEENWLGALQLLETGASPPADPVQVDEGENTGATKLSVLAARLGANRQLLVAFAPADAHITECLVNGVPAAFNVDEESGRVAVSRTVASRTVEIRGHLVDGIPLRSNLAWVDDEDQLRRSPAMSPALNALKTHAHQGTWSAGAWVEVMDLFAKHLSQLPTPPARARGKAAAEGRDRPEPPGLYALDDALAPTTRPGRSGATALTLALEHLGGQQESTLPALLKQWFATPDDPPADPFGPSDNDPTQEQGSETPAGRDGNDEPVDAPTRFPKAKRSVGTSGEGHKHPPSDRKMKEILKAIEVALAHPGFCAHRPAKILGVDLQLIALLLGTALREGWISADQHLEVSHVAWGAIFLDGGPEAPRGWLAKRIADEGERAAEFAKAFRSPQLIAALLGWAYGCDQAPPGRLAAAFELAASLAIAKLPEDWCSESPEQIAQALGSFVLNAGPAAPTAEDIRSGVRLHWSRMTELGVALVELAEVVNATGYRNLLARLPKLVALEAGALLLQPNGYFIVRERKVLAPGDGVPVDRVANPMQPAHFDHTGVAPVESIIADGVLPAPHQLSATARNTIAKHLAQLRKAYRPATRESLSL